MRELTAGATVVRRIGKLKVDGALSDFDGVEPEVSGGSQAPMNGLGTGHGPMRGRICTDFCQGLHPDILALDFTEMYMYEGRPV